MSESVTTNKPDASERAQVALDAFERVVQSTPGFRLREGQHAMAQCVAHTLSRGALGSSDPEAERAIAVVQAGTGVGKSAAYASTAVALALQRKTRVLISTATVALQEQLMQKDLPALAATMQEPFAFALAKGRGRYVCKLKLERIAGTGAGDDDLFDDEFPAQSGGTGTATQLAVEERRTRLYEHMAHLMAKGDWDGDRDNLPDAPEPGDWSTVAAERHTCTARHCPRYGDCSYYQARNQLAQAQVIVANHDLVLSTLGLKALPDLDNCLVVFDEGHHLPAVALDQFSSNMDMSSLRWLDKLPRTVNDVAQKLQLSTPDDVASSASDLKAVLTTLGRMTLDAVHAHTKGEDGTLRFANGVLPPELQEPLGQAFTLSGVLSRTLESLGAQIKTLSREDPSQAAMCAQMYAKLGPLAPRTTSVHATTAALLEEPLDTGTPPQAKWLSVATANGYLNLGAHACPIVPGDLLRTYLWSHVRSAVVTSATLTSCGSFDFFLQEAGLQYVDGVQTLAVSSSFDYATQGELTVVHTRSDPKLADLFTTEMVRALMHDLQSVERGALVLFTSRAQMRAATGALPMALVDRVLVQGTQSRNRLLAAHQARVEAGLPSILFGLQSFGEGLDLPGALCEWLFITKLPFAPPTEPVDEARAEWLRSQQRDPFNELVVPATGMRLLQWTGRAIRTETDRAHIVCYDKRLQLQAYGRRMLAGLPPYPVHKRDAV